MITKPTLYTVYFGLVVLCKCQNWTEWKNSPPSDIPFEKSTDILTYEYENGANYQYGGKNNAADTWYPTWSSDGNLYSPWTDGTIICTSANGKNVTISSASHAYNAPNQSTTGYATVIGNDPTKLTITNCGTFRSSAYPYQGRYPCASLFYNNTWFYGTYLVNASDDINDTCGNWCEQVCLVWLSLDVHL